MTKEEYRAQRMTKEEYRARLTELKLEAWRHCSEIALRKGAKASDIRESIRDWQAKISSFVANNLVC